MSSLFCDEKPKDESEDAPVPERGRRLRQQAAQYCKAKEILYSQAAPPEEKQAALAEREQLYDEGFSVAAHLLGKAYRDGAGVQRDEGAAEWWFSKAAMVGSDVSEYALGRLLEQQGRFTEAAAWYQKAVDQDNQYAQYRLAKLLLDGEEIPKDTEKALRLLTTAAEQDNQFAQYTLGKLYLLGKEIPQDREAAVYWLTLSAQQGNEYAKYFLEHPDSWRKASVSQGIGRLLRHLGDMFRAAAPSPPADTPRITDRRLLRKLREKQAAMGLKSGGHGNGGIRMGSS